MRSRLAFSHCLRSPSATAHRTRTVVAVGLCACALSSTWAQASDLHYEDIIDLARRGEHARALAQLEVWQQRHPDDERARFDTITVLAWAGDDARAVEQARRWRLDALPAYALKGAAHAARNLHDGEWAAAAYRVVLQRSPDDCDALAGLAGTQIDEGRADAADAALTRAEATCLNGDAPATMRDVVAARSDWAARRQDRTRPNPLAAIAWWVERLSALPPSRGRALQAREALLLASSNGLIDRARAWLPLAEPAMTRDERARLLAQSAAQRIRWANELPEKKRPIALRMLHEALRDLDAAQPLAEAYTTLRSISSDAVAALALLGQDGDAVARAIEAESRGLVLHPQAQIALTDVYMRRGQAREAERRARLALGLLQGASEYDRRDANVALFYALTEQSRYGEAERLAGSIAGNVEPIVFRGLAPVEIENDDYVRILLVRAQLASLALSRDRYGESREWLDKLLRDAPYNVDARLDEADWLSARGFYRAAQRTTQLVLADQPDKTRALESRARELLDVHAYAEFAPALRSLQSSGTQPQRVEQVRQAYARETSAAISGDLTAGSSAASGPVFGSNDLESGLTAYSRLYDERWRLKAKWRVATGTFDGKHVRTDHVDAGVRAYWPYVWLEALVAPQVSNHQGAGTRLAGEWMAFDGTTLSGRIERDSAEPPLRAQVAGVRGDLAQAAIELRAWPQFTIGSSVVRTQFSDDNQRTDISAYASTGASFADRWRGELRLDVGRSRNTRSDTVYYSPQRETAASVAFTLRQTFWREGERGWSHQLTAGGGVIAQAGFAGSPAYSLNYEHEWRLDARHVFAVSIGRTQRPYDGIQDRRHLFSLRFESLL